MRSLRDATGRFPERPYYECAELNELCEHVVEGFLTRKYGSPLYPIKTGDLELLLEEQDVVLDPYCDLSHYGATTEGASVFEPNAPYSGLYLARFKRRPAPRESLSVNTCPRVRARAAARPPLRAAKTGDLFEAPDTSRAATCKRQSIEPAPASALARVAGGLRVRGAAHAPRRRKAPGVNPSAETLPCPPADRPARKP